MKRICLFVCLLVFVCTVVPAGAVDLTLSWDPAARATGYSLFMTVDGGATWEQRDVGNVMEYVWEGVLEDQKVEWKVGAYNEIGTAINEWALVSYEHRKRPPKAPSGFGLR